MSLTCLSCDIEHDLDRAPDTGECVACGGQLVEDDRLRPDYLARMREVMETTVDNLASARGVSREDVLAAMTAPVYVQPKSRSGRD